MIYTLLSPTLRMMIVMDECLGWNLPGLWRSSCAGRVAAAGRRWFGGSKTSRLACHVWLLGDDFLYWFSLKKARNARFWIVIGIEKEGFCRFWWTLSDHANVDRDPCCFDGDSLVRLVDLCMDVLLEMGILDCQDCQQGGAYCDRYKVRFEMGFFTITAG